ncbi:YbdK family carboxylate-amine ligase [Arsukibacterium sp.]|uniref:carboxylate-amine ligase n=1 Tax=Arsukibacterium sp. TaxID=1977258 RepID=UPI001BD1EA5E|nr:YbdK family carboxylate-amine ligase [Arsukibacterium sp.]
MSIKLSFGNEEEFLLLKNTQPFVMPLQPLRAEPDCPPGIWSYEAHQGVLEHATPVYHSLHGLYQHILHSRAFLARVANSMQLDLFCGGTHPSLDWPTLKMTADYQAVVDEYQDTVRALTLFGMHTHIGISDHSLLVQVFNALRPFLAPLLALSANSPFYRGRDTGLCSYRAMQFLLMPRTGTPPMIQSVQGEQARISELLRRGCIHKATSIWTDARLHPTYNTIEVRICDMQTSPQHAAALAVITGAIAIWLAQQIDSGLQPDYGDDWLLREDRWQAARRGLSATIQQKSTTEAVTAFWYRMLDNLMPILQQQRVAEVAETIKSMLHYGGGATIQRQERAAGPSPQLAVVN